MKQLIFAVIGISLSLLFAMSADAATNLQELINMTEENGLLELDATTYEGNIVISKPLTIKGQDGTIIRGDGNGNVVTIDTSDSKLLNLTIENSGMSRSSKEEYSGVRIIGENNTVEDLTIRDIFHGIYLNKAHGTTIKKVHITGHGADKLGNQGNGIHIMRSSKNIIENSFITNTRDGVYVEYSNNNKISNNTMTKTRYGLHYMYSNNNEFHNNHFIRNVGGAAIMHSDHILLEGNEFSFNEGSRAFGLLIQTSRDIHVLNNDFHLNKRGLYLEQSTSNLIESNDFFHNDIAIELWTSSTAHVFIKNNFRKNINDVITVGGRSNNEWHRAGVGNYWNKPMLDLNRDGVGDHPFEYKSSLNELIEHNELAYLFLNNPAITIYDKMNQLLSSEKVMAEDLYPLIKDERPFNWWNIGIVITFIAFSLIYFYRRRQIQ